MRGRIHQSQSHLLSDIREGKKKLNLYLRLVSGLFAVNVLGYQKFLLIIIIGFLNLELRGKPNYF